MAALYLMIEFAISSLSCPALARALKLFAAKIQRVNTPTTPTFRSNFIGKLQVFQKAFFSSLTVPSL
jgi:hypothetical protein